MSEWEGLWLVTGRGPKDLNCLSRDRYSLSHSLPLIVMHINKNKIVGGKIKRNCPFPSHLEARTPVRTLSPSSSWRVDEVCLEPDPN